MMRLGQSALPTDVYLSSVSSLYEHRKTLLIGMLSHVVTFLLVYLKTSDPLYLACSGVIFVLWALRNLDMARFDKDLSDPTLAAQVDELQAGSAAETAALQQALEEFPDAPADGADLHLAGEGPLARLVPDVDGPAHHPRVVAGGALLPPGVHVAHPPLRLAVAVRLRHGGPLHGDRVVGGLHDGGCVARIVQAQAHGLVAEAAHLEAMREAALAAGQNPPSYDKQFVRDYLETLDWNKTAPGPSLPPEVIERTRAKYAEALQKLAGITVD